MRAIAKLRVENDSLAPPKFGSGSARAGGLNSTNAPIHFFPAGMVRPTRCGWSFHSPSARTRLVGNTLACLLLLPLRTKGLLRTTTAAPTSSGRLRARSTRSRNDGSSSTRRDAMTAVHGDGDGAALPRSAPSVCVIGAGSAGLAAGRCLREEGCRVTILEKSHDVGGVWRYKPEPEARAPMCECLFAVGVFALLPSSWRLT